MKTILLFLLCSVSLLFCTSKAEQEQLKGRSMVPGPSDTIDFKTQVQPIFQKKCSPCHFPGGKMYERMPFDKAETIIAFQDKIVKRIKDEQELHLIQQFISQHQ